MTDHLAPIKIIRASAGTGKTYRLATEFNRSINNNVAAGTNNTIATTFTNKAAEELQKRIRQMLLNSGKWEAAQRLLAAKVGTVNSVCGRLVSDLALEAGISPSVKVIAEDQRAEIFNMAVEEVTSRYAVELWRIAHRMGKDEDCRDDVVRLTELARQNNIGPVQLSQLAAVSWTQLCGYLPNCRGNFPEFEVALLSEMRTVLRQLPCAGDKTEATRQTVNTLTELDISWQSTGEIPWRDLVRIAKLRTGEKSSHVLERLPNICSEHVYLPEFQQDIQRFLRSIFECSAECLSTYRDFKLERGLLDFTDQEKLALWLLKRSDVRTVLKERFSSLFVDEFQDTSPVQLATFVEIAQLVNESVWVGDEKQSIFGFRGTDPVLMQRVVEVMIPKSGGTCDYLSKSYRARPTLVKFVNEVFRESADTLGVGRNDIEIHSTHKSENRSMNQAIHLWWLDNNKRSESIASGIKQILSTPDYWLIEHEVGGATRPIAGSDIAILCRSNSHRLELASALHNYGILVSTERPGLMQMPECILSLALLRYLADRYDTLAMAELVRYTDVNQTHDHWLYEWLDKGPQALLESSPALIAAERLREQLLGLTPSESLQIATSTPMVLDSILSWGNFRQRLQNLNALSGLAKSYEDYCAAGRQAATVAGLVAFINTFHKNALQPATPDKQSVQILTYHSAKGLEWPMVVMTELGSVPPATPFGLNVCPPNETFDPLDPLKGRSIRYWPWPYGQHRTDDFVKTAIENSQEMTQARTERQAEAIRLLYVGMTRAKDYLVLACASTPRGADWLRIAKKADGHSAFNLKAGSEGQNCILPHEPTVVANCVVMQPEKEDPSELRVSSCERYTPSRIESRLQDLPYACVPSTLRSLPNSCTRSVLIEKEISLGGRLLIAPGVEVNGLGDAVHSFLAVDDTPDTNTRLRLAAQILSNHQVVGIDCSELLRASSRLKEKLDDMYPDAMWLREWPVTARYNNQRVVGLIDLLLQLPEGYVIIDHKSFPGAKDDWRTRAASYYPQLHVYAAAVEQATGTNVVATYIHLPVSGHLVKLGIDTSGHQDIEDEQNWLLM